MCMYSLKTRCSGAAQFFLLFYVFCENALDENMSLYFLRHKLRSIYIYIDLTFKSDTKLICNRSNMFISIIELSACAGDVTCPLKRRSFSVQLIASDRDIYLIYSYKYVLNISKLLWSHHHTGTIIFGTLSHFQIL